MKPPTKSCQPADFDSFVEWLGRQSFEDQNYLIKLAFEDQQLRDLERGFMSLRREQRQEIFQRLGLASHLIKRIPGPEEKSLFTANMSYQPQSQGSRASFKTDSVESQPAVVPSRSSKNVGPIVAVLALIGIAGVAIMNFSHSGFSGLKPKQTGSSIMDKDGLSNRSSEQTVDIEEQASEVKGRVIGQVILRAKGPSWVTLRRNGQVEYEGNLEGEKKINKPVEIEIYAGRPDLIEVSAEGLPTRTVGTIDDIRWLPLIP